MKCWASRRSRLGVEEEKALKEKIDEALFGASLVSNQLFDLPEQPSAVPTVDIADASLNAAVLPEFERRLLAAIAREKGIRLSAAEFFVDRIESRLMNSRALDLTQTETVLHTEFILLARAGARENEYINRYSRRYKADFDLEGEVAQSARFAREATTAGLPKTGDFPVLISDEPLDHIFNPLVARASGRLKYNKMISSEIGKPVVDGGKAKGDSVTLWSNNLLKGALGSSRFDGYGTPAERVCLIRDNQLQSLQPPTNATPTICIFR